VLVVLYTMKKAFLFIFLCWSLNDYSQTPTCGILVDATGKMPIPNVSVYNKTLNKGCISDAGGKFSILTNAGDTLWFSSVGYEKKQAIIEKYSCDTFFLARKTIQGEEVVVEKFKGSKNYSIGKIKNRLPKGGTVIAIWKGRVIGDWFNNPFQNRAIFFTSLKFNIRSPNGFLPKQLKLYLFETVSDSIISQSLLDEPFIDIITWGKQKAISLNLQPLGIRVPQGGFYIGVEMLGNAETTANESDNNGFVVFAKPRKETSKRSLITKPFKEYESLFYKNLVPIFEIEVTEYLK
jgi:CarboxypepD_reg-like domain